VLCIYKVLVTFQAHVCCLYLGGPAVPVRVFCV